MSAVRNNRPVPFMISGTTELLAIVGSPIAQVKSPENFNAWFARHNKNASMIPIDLDRDSLDDFVDTLRAWRNLRGCVVTVPYKHEIAKHLDALSERARSLACVNVIRREADGTLVGDMVDGDGFINAARRNGFEAGGKRVLIVGAGGAGSAIAWSLCEQGVASLTLADLDAARAQRLAALLAARFPAVTTRLQFDSLEAFDLVVNASPAGMTGNDALPVAEEKFATLRAGTLVADVVTTPEITRFLALAHRAGCRIQTGAEMAMGQFGYLGAFMNITPLAA
ncbi:shikimate dehydrogenase [Burkholderia sp. SRS-W-2-2016]|uniref:shikimate dehydrogenase family protein n=1 Tax=Burkholderia sp. SRS-W-2-2016 TaxID=1926878 RepID=UPI00273CF8D9|nr:shikimate dehydrogenase [Burkholderia sp. SRS-W-2-2016]